MSGAVLACWTDFIMLNDMVPAAPKEIANSAKTPTSSRYAMRCTAFPFLNTMGYGIITMSVQIGEIKGIPIRLHFTLVIVFLLISWTIATALMPDFVPGLSDSDYWIIGVASAAMLFISVLLHELSHSIVATRYGVKVRQIMLFAFGGVSDITAELRDYRKEARMAFAGPLTSFAISGVFALFYWLIIIQQVLPFFWHAI